MIQKLFEETIQRMMESCPNMNSIILFHKGTEYKYRFPNKPESGDIHSISKPITCLCAGLAIGQGYFPLGINEPIMKYLHEYNVKSKHNRTYLKNATIRHLLTLTLGHEKMLLGSKSIAELKEVDLVSHVLNTPILHEPGEYFSYTSSSAYLMSVIIQNVTNMKLLDYANRYLFEPLEISCVTWRESLQGYNLGCTGITMTNHDLNKIGRLLLNNGKYSGKVIVSYKWIQEMKTIQILTPKMFDETSAIPKYGYGLNLWICENGNYFCDGTDGQYIIIIPSKNYVISTIGNQVNMRPITECLRRLL